MTGAADLRGPINLRGIHFCRYSCAKSGCFEDELQTMSQAKLLIIDVGYVHHTISPSMSPTPALVQVPAAKVPEIEDGPTPMVS